jgi:hypothetical protein
MLGQCSRRWSLASSIVNPSTPGPPWLLVVRGVSPAECRAACRAASGRLLHNTGNSVRLGLRERILACNLKADSIAYDAIPYASEQGIYFGLSRELNRGIREFFGLIRESRSRPLFPALPSRQIRSSRQISNVAETGAQGRRQMLEVAVADLELKAGFVLTPEACRISLVESVDENDRRSGLHEGGVRSCRARPGAPGSPLTGDRGARSPLPPPL